VVVIGTVKTEPREDVLALEAFKALVEPTHRDEGCILYALHQGVDERAGSRSSTAGPRTSCSTAT